MGKACSYLIMMCCCHHIGLREVRFPYENKIRVERSRANKGSIWCKKKEIQRNVWQSQKWIRLCIIILWLYLKSSYCWNSQQKLNRHFKWTVNYAAILSACNKNLFFMPPRLYIIALPYLVWWYLKMPYHCQKVETEL
jgi:hypothetical protein